MLRPLHRTALNLTGSAWMWRQHRLLSIDQSSSATSTRLPVPKAHAAARARHRVNGSCRRGRPWQTTAPPCSSSSCPSCLPCQTAAGEGVEVPWRPCGSCPKRPSVPVQASLALVTRRHQVVARVASTHHGRSHQARCSCLPAHRLLRRPSNHLARPLEARYRPARRQMASPRLLQSRRACQPARGSSRWSKCD